MTYEDECFISGIEFTRDYGFRIDKEDLEKYNLLIQKRSQEENKMGVGAHCLS